MITKRCINIIRSGTPVSFHLQTNKITTPSICVRIDNATRYCPLHALGSGILNVRYNNSIYSAVDIIPIAHIAYNVVDSPDSYNPRYLFKIFSIKMLSSCTINNAIDVQLKIVTTWTTVLSLASAGTSASMIANTRYASYTCRLKIGNWTSSEFSVLGNSTRDVSIPEAQWGV